MVDSMLTLAGARASTIPDIFRRSSSCCYRTAQNTTFNHARYFHGFTWRFPLTAIVYRASLLMSTYISASSYSEATRALNDTTFILDLNEATQQYAKMQNALFTAFATISAQLHSLDLQRMAPPLRPKWNRIHAFENVMKHMRTNTVDLSGRAKMFCTVVLPILARNLNNVTPRSHQEKIQILQSYMKITSDHLSLNQNYVGAILNIISNLTAFHNELAQLACQHSSSVSDRSQLRDLAAKFLQLENHLKQLFYLFKNTQPDTTTVTKTSTRLIAFSVSRPKKSKLSPQRVALTDENMARVYDQLEQCKSEVTHAQYTAQIHKPTDALNTARSTVSSFVFDLMVNVEHGLSLFLAVWSSIINDCRQMVVWLQNPVTSIPPSMSVYADTGMMLYAPIGAALDLYNGKLDIK
ncbi:uncharacterized protein EV420DRAFT_17391 [Desarmillaria tabescens]|uniref:Uncharacterized protein n=1 Tax=Armillaria tabescens TaxID=1929756 RepID=A0AA39NP39_ARMTA|nr:uncharacterized protein EV420DRAFT_17391 [Desarmillaria tabescens]KAK0469247.1 hypothetical protein EV420DRAFT_17391 [Desarmillaria tabescens]